MLRYNDDKIKTLQSKLDEWKFVDEEFIPDELKQFSYSLVHICSWLDITLDTLIGLYLTEKLKSKLTDEERLEVVSRLDVIISPMNFSKKLEYTKNIGLINVIFFTKVKRVIDLKNAFSHPHINKYFLKIQKLQKNGAELEKEMENLIDVTEYFDALKRGQINF
jgi:hypothetical protein